MVRKGIKSMKALYDKLTKRQQQTMQKHSKHHSKKHMMSMAKAMIKGSTFTAAHKIAKKEVGN